MNSAMLNRPVDSPISAAFVSFVGGNRRSRPAAPVGGERILGLAQVIGGATLVRRG